MPRAASSEHIAKTVLESLGYRVLSLRHKIVMGDVEAGEIDIVAEKRGIKYAVEVKAGKASLTDIRQAYGNATAVKMTPLIIAKGYADEAAQALAEKLGVKLIMLPEYYLMTPEEIQEAMKRVLIDVLAELFRIPQGLTHEDQILLEKISSCPTLEKLAERLGVDKLTAGKLLGNLKRRKILTIKGGYQTLRLQATAILITLRVLSMIGELK